LALEVGGLEVLDGNILEGFGSSAVRVTADHLVLPQPVAQPPEMTVAFEGVGQKIAEDNYVIMQFGFQ
jgi:hypothetical protein